MIDRFIGVDGQTSRGCPFAILETDGNALDAGWLDEGNGTATALGTVATRHAEGRLERFAMRCFRLRTPCSLVIVLHM